MNQENSEINSNDHKSGLGFSQEINRRDFLRGARNLGLGVAGVTLAVNVPGFTKWASGREKKIEAQKASMDEIRNTLEIPADVDLMLSRIQRIEILQKRTEDASTRCLESPQDTDSCFQAVNGEKLLRDAQKADTQMFGDNAGLTGVVIVDCFVGTGFGLCGYAGIEDMVDAVRREVRYRRDQGNHSLVDEG